MMMKFMITIGAFMFCVSGLVAQEKLQPKKYENVTWHNIVKVDYKPGLTWRAKQIIKMYKAAGKEAGTKGPEEYWFSTGKYDAMFIWTMEGGPADMEWWRTEDNIKWRDAMIKQVGSEEKLRELQKEFSGLISSSTSDICRKEIQ